ncbi:hypothetical protein PVAND_009124 [Polypedilum vanderplanki]|uniref:CRAL-TRIO domain-containing protein n=1 Tax=Polypedilum vanderplanki TaxID=319348 RepID=A0A9J6CBQ7_POLVA|nr:hypothetical protein PVAND_009124 [Polypedilum vanderplanki]
MSTDLKFDYLTALSRLNFNQSQIDFLRNSAKKCQSIPQSLTNKQLLLFLNKCNGDIDNTLELLVRHYEIKKKAPQLFKNRDVKTKELQQSLQNQYYLNLPLTKGCTVCYFALQNSHSQNFHYNASTTCFLMMCESALSKYGPTKGLILIYDMKNFRLGHLTRNNIKSMKSFFDYIQRAYLLNVEQIHILNTFSSFHLIMKIISPFMDAEVVKKMHLHSSNIDLEKFYATFIPKENLPSDYGGELISISELHENHCEELLKMKEYFIEESKFLFKEHD